MALISADKYAHLHADFKGPGDARPTALQIVADNNMTGALKGKTILITGTSSGIGIATAEALATTGADLFLAVRNLPKAREALKQVLDDQGKNGRGRAELLQMDMDSLDSVRKAAEEFKSKSDNLTILIANAGIMAVPTLEHTKDGFERQFGVNHLAHFLLFILLRPLLLASSTKEFNSRVVMLSSSGHRGGGILPGDYNFEKEEYSAAKGYGQSKTANIYMANEIERRYGSRGLHANSLMPGGIETGLQQYVPAETRAKWFTDNPYVKSIEQGAATTVLAAIGKDWEGVGGKYMEDCQESFEQKDPGNPASQGYVKHAFDEQLEGTLWKDSLVMVGEKDEE